MPSILSGRWPAEHRNWSYFVYSPENSPFKFLRPLRWLPRAVTSRRIFRRWLSRAVKARLRFKGYFDLYNINFKHITLFDFSEKKSPLQPRGMNRGPNIFDVLEEQSIPYHVSSPARSEQENLAALESDIRAEKIDFAFLYWPGLDGLLHNVGNKSPEIPTKLGQYEAWIEQLLATTRKHYGEVKLYVFSDHGMANCDEILNLRRVIEALPVRMPDDFVVIYDSTMARFWFKNNKARQQITGSLAGVRQGRILPDEELKRMGTFFEDRYFGELIFLVREGVLIVPSDMGERPLTAMHGYHPTDPQSYALLCTNQPTTPDDINAIPDVFRLMEADAAEAHERNRAPVEALPG